MAMTQKALPVYNRLLNPHVFNGSPHGQINVRKICNVQTPSKRIARTVH